MKKKEEKQVSLRFFIIISLLLVLISGVVGSIIGVKYSDFEMKNNHKSLRSNINYNDIKEYKLEDYSELIKNNYLKKISYKTPTEVKLFYSNNQDDNLKDQYFKMYIDLGTVFTYDSITGKKVQYFEFWDRAESIYINQKPKETNDRIIAIQEKNKSVYLTNYSDETKYINTFSKLETDKTFEKIYSINNDLYILDSNNKYYKIIKADNIWTTERNDIFNDGTVLKTYELGNRILKIDFDGTFHNYNEDLTVDNIIKDTNDKEIYVNQVITDCTSIDKNEYMMYIISNDGILYKRKIDNNFTLSNNKFEIVGKLKGINIEEKSLNILLNDNNTLDYIASTKYEIYNIME